MSDPKESPDDVLYVKNEEGTVHSVTREHYNKYLTEVTTAGRRFPLPGFEVVKEADARKASPQLFGVPDPAITYTDDELVRAATRKKLLAELHGGPTTPAE